jgi:C_GCAxxG_C_C family probable redox protein
MLVNKVKKYYDAKTYDLNCAETIMYAVNEEYNLNLSVDTYKSVAAFGGGMGIEGVCGALTGALAALGILYTDEKAHQSPLVKELSIEFITSFEQELKCSNCRELKEKHRNEEIRCEIIVEKTAEILQEIIKKNKFKL